MQAFASDLGIAPHFLFCFFSAFLNERMIMFILYMWSKLFVPVWVETLNILHSIWNSIGIYSCIMFLILLGRAAFVFPLSALSNCMNRTSSRSSTINFKHQVSTSNALLCTLKVSWNLSWISLAYSTALNGTNLNVWTSNCMDSMRNQILKHHRWHLLILLCKSVSQTYSSIGFDYSLLPYRHMS